jgi:DNA-binding NarL/FixJ family response regulator
MSKADLKKIKGQALLEARIRTGAHKDKIEITDREWEAIQLGAISNNVLSQILDNMDPKDIKVRATPRTTLKMTDTKVAKAKSMAALGYTTAEIASALGVSATTVQETIK